MTLLLSFKKNVEKLSELERMTRRHPPMEDAVWLLEHVAKTKESFDIAFHA